MKPNLTGHATSMAASFQQGLAQTRTFLRGSIQAKRVVIAAADITDRTEAHPLNPRNQDALTNEAVRDILLSIAEHGVNVEGVAVKCPETGKLLLLDASRRRYCCIETATYLPLWVLQGDISDEVALAIINDSQEVKRWSYPEHADFLMRVARRKGLDVESINIDELAKALSIGRESLRKRLEANNVSIALRKVFPDSEGIPNGYYSKLAKLERQLTKAKKTVSDAMIQFTSDIKDVDLDADVKTRQSATLAALETFIERHVGSNKIKREWTTISLAEFEDKDTYAKASRSADGKKIKIELARAGAEKMRLVEQYIKDILAGKITK